MATSTSTSTRPLRCLPVARQGAALFALLGAVLVTVGVWSSPDVRTMREAALARLCAATAPAAPVAVVSDPHAAPSSKSPAEGRPASPEPGEDRPLAARDAVTCITEGTEHYCTVYLFRGAILAKLEEGRPPRFVPKMRAGEPVGVKVYGLQPDGLGRAMGLRNGDLIETLNDEVVGNVDQLQAQLNGAITTSLRARVARRGVPHSWKILMTPGPTHEAFRLDDLRRTVRAQ